MANLGTAANPGTGPNLTTTLITVGVAAVVSFAVALVSYKASTSAARQQVQQRQMNEILSKRIEIYPKLWRTHIYYETNWTLEERAKTKEWAEDYVAALNEFNLEGGLFFSQDLYDAFFTLREELYNAIQETEKGKEVTEERAKKIRDVVYGVDGQSGMSTYLKDDLGSYQKAVLQKRST